MSRYIDADNLIKKMQERYNNLSNGDGFYDHFTQGYEDALSTVENEPTADVREVKHGKWLNYRFGLEVVTCSICRAVYEGGDSFRFCPKCGAKMDLEDDK